MTLISSADFKAAMRPFGAAVNIITTAHDGQMHGVTATAVCSVSAAPPSLLVCINRSASIHNPVRAARHFCVNLLSADQVELARRFSRPHADRFAGVPHRPGFGGAPLIDGCIAWFECLHHAQHTTGDHVLFIGEVQRCERRSGIGLVFHHGRYATTRPLDERDAGD